MFPVRYFGNRYFAGRYFPHYGIVIVYGFGDIVLTNQAVNVANLTLTDVWIVLPSCAVDSIQNTFSTPNNASVSFSESNSVSIAMEPVL